MSVKLPGAEAIGQRPSIQPATAIQGYRAVDAQALLAPGTAEAQLGQEMIQQGDKIAIQAKHEQDRLDTLRAEDAFTKLRAKQLDLTVGEQNGFTRLKGSATVNRATPIATEWSKRFDDEVRMISDSLATDGQREKFRQRANLAQLQFREDMTRHTVAESNVYAKEVYEGTVAIETQAAAANWNEPAKVFLSLERVDSAVKDMAERLGWPKEYTAAIKQGNDTKIHQAVIQQAIANNQFQFAQDWFDVYRDDIDKNTAATLAKVVEDGTQKQIANGYQTEYLAAAQDMTALVDLQKKVQADPKLDDARKNALVGRIQGQALTLQNRAILEGQRQERIEERALRARERAQDRAQRVWERQTGRLINSAREDILAGFEPSVTAMGPLIAATKGTELEGEVRELVALAGATRQFRMAPPQQQEAWLTQLTAQSRTDAGGVSRKVVQHLGTIYNQQQAQIKADPTTYAIRQGLVDPTSPAAKPLDLTKPETLGPQLAARLEIGRAMVTQYQAPLKPLTKEEADLFSNRLQNSDTAGKRAIFGELAKITGKDLQGFRAIMGQIAPDAPTLAIAGVYAAKGYSQTDGTITPGNGRMVSDLILQGHALLNPPRGQDGKPVGGVLMPMPPEKPMLQQFDNRVRDAFAGMGEARSAHFQAAREIYAKLSSDAGDKDTSVLDAGRWDKAIQLATGGIERYRGAYTVMPYGYDLGKFKDELNLRLNILQSNGTLPEGASAAKLRELPVVPMGDGMYAFKAGDALVGKAVPGPDGKPVMRPLIIDLNQPAVPLGLPSNQVTASEIEAASQPFRGKTKAKQ